MSSFTDDELDTIRRAISKYRAARGGQRMPTICMEINEWHDPVAGKNTDEPLNLKTLQRFMDGNRVRYQSAHLIRDFMDAKEPIDNIEAIADAAVTLFGALTPGGATGSETVASRLFGSFVSAYDVFIWGNGYKRNPDLKVKKTPKGLSYFEGEYYVPIHSDEELSADPYRVVHSRIELSTIPYADWLQATEYIRNPRMRHEDIAWQGSERARGILTVGDTERLFILILRGDNTRGARIYLLQPHSEDYEKPAAERRYLGGVVTRTDEGFPTSAAAANVQFVPASDKVLGEADKIGSVQIRIHPFICSIIIETDFEGE